MEVKSREKERRKLNVYILLYEFQVAVLQELD